MTDQLRVGLVGAGPWATNVHAPGIAAHPDTALVGVWARRPEAARALATAHGAVPFDDVASLVAAVDAVAFAVPPSVQVPLAVEAARAGRHVILEKPIASNVADAQRLADAVATAGVASVVMLVLRFAPETRSWLDDVAATGGWQAGTARWLGGGLLGGPYQASPWRHSEGALSDIGPHTIDVLEAALGPVAEVLAATSREPDLWHLILEHTTGATSTLSLSAKLALRPTITSLELYGEHGHSVMPGRTTPAADSYAVLLDEFVAMTRGGVRAHPLDVHHGLHLQRVIDAARALT
jgi:predicted dehydrogenase